MTTAPHPLGPEFSRMVDATRFDGKPVAIEANDAERAALARRFGLVSIGRLEAEVTLVPDGEAVLANGALRAEIVQSCAVSGEDLPVAIDEPLALRFVPEQAAATEEEVELSEDELDEIPFTGKSFDLGEAVAQSLALAIDPYATGPQAEVVRHAQLGDADSSPFAALSKLKQ
jgi:uncharacterized metal-binding protein YceD (DUF177 family)